MSPQEEFRVPSANRFAVLFFPAPGLITKKGCVFLTGTIFEKKVLPHRLSGAILGLIGQQIHCSLFSGTRPRHQKGMCVLNKNDIRKKDIAPCPPQEQS